MPGCRRRSSTWLRHESELPGTIALAQSLTDFYWMWKLDSGNPECQTCEQSVQRSFWERHVWHKHEGMFSSSQEDEKSKNLHIQLTNEKFSWNFFQWLYGLLLHFPQLSSTFCLVTNPRKPFLEQDVFEVDRNGRRGSVGTLSLFWTRFYNPRFLCFCHGP